jgi:hypothetical protein
MKDKKLYHDFLEMMSEAFPEIFTPKLQKIRNPFKRYDVFINDYDKQCKWAFKRLQNAINLNQIENYNALIEYLDSEQHSIQNEVELLKKYLSCGNNMCFLQYHTPTNEKA